MPVLALGWLRVALIVAALAAIVVLLGAFSDPVRIGCLALIAVATVLSFGEFRRPGGGWWALLAAGAVLSVAGAAIAQAAETAGGIVAVLGAALVICGAAIGLPAPGSD